MNKEVDLSNCFMVKNKARLIKRLVTLFKTVYEDRSDIIKIYANYT